MNAIQPGPPRESDASYVPAHSLAPDDMVNNAPSPLALILGIALKHKWLIAGTVVACFLVGLVLTLLATPQYKAVATIQIQREQRNFTNIESAQRQESASVDAEFYQTQYGLLESELLATQVAAELRLQDNAAFYRMFKSGKAVDWFDGNRVKSGAGSRANRLHEAATILLRHFSVDADRNSQLVRLSFTSPDPALSQKVANSWGAEFIKSSLDRRYQATSYARNFLESRLAQLRNRIDTSERGLVEYGAQQGIITVPTGGVSGDSATSGASGSTSDVPLVATDLAAMNTELARAIAARVIAQSRLSGGASVVAESLTNGAINSMRARRAELAVDYAKMLEQFDPQFPAAVSLRSQLAILDRNIRTEEARVGASLQSDYKAAAARESDLQRRVTDLKKSYTDLRRRSIQYDIIQRDVDTNRQLYAALLQRFKEIGVSGGVGVNNISIVDQATLPVAPSSPKLIVNLFVAILTGVLLGAAIAFVLEQIDSGVSNPNDVRLALGLPTLGLIPKVEDEPLRELADSKSAISEAYSSVQTVMELGTDHGFPKSLVVTSSRPGEGKSTTSYALASRLARLGRSTILVDADMRSPSIAHMLDFDKGLGLSNYLSGKSGLDELVRSTSEPMLSVMLAGATPPNTTELLAGRGLANLLTELLARFDHVVIDSPPVMGIADAPLLASQVEGVVFVVEARKTSKAMARVAIGRLLSSRARLIGVVVGKFDRKSAANGYGYDYNYQYSYGNSSAEGRVA